MAELNYTPEQRAAIEHTGAALLISAAAGSGKTRVLVERLMRAVCLQGEDIDRYLVITFTRAAAAELRGRILDALTAALAADPANRHIRRQMTLVYRAQIGTIHAFCAAVVREHAHLCGVRPDFRMLDESEGKALRAAVLDDVLEQRYDRMSDRFAELVDTLAAGRDDAALQQLVLQAYETVQSRPYPEAWMREQMALPLEADDAGRTVWGDWLLQRTRDTLDGWIDAMRRALDSLAFDEKLQRAYSASFLATIDDLRAFRAAADTGWDACCGRTVAFPRLSTPRGFAGDPVVEQAKRVREACKKEMGRLALRFDTGSADLLADCRTMKRATDELLGLVLEFSRAFAQEKRRRGVVDFHDLEHLALGLLVDPARGGPTAEAREISRRYAGILVDEYQDVNQVQDMLFSAVSDDERNLTMVGDVKQSIYRFRLADPTIFLERYDRFADEPAPSAPRRILLARNFRSRREILDEVNRVFAAILSRKLGEMDYTEREYLRYGGGYGDAETPDAVTLQALIAPPDADREARVKLEAAWIAEQIAQMVEAQMPVAGRPCTWGDFAILLRSPKDWEETYAQALRARGIPAATGKAVSILERPEMRTLLSLLQVIDNPRQDVPLIAVLRSPLYGFTADELAMVRACAPEGDFYQALCASGSERARAFLEELARFRDAAAELPTDRLLQWLFDTTGLPALAVRGDPDAQARLYLLLDYAREFESRGYRGLFAFVTQLREQMEQEESPLRLAPAASGQDVRICSIHSAKGLEYPVVFLADLMKSFNLSDAQRPLLIHPQLGVGARYLDRSRRIEYPTLAHMAIAEKLREQSLSEEMRVLYVAMTRAREKLVMVCTLREKTLEAVPRALPLPLPTGALWAADSAGAWLLMTRFAAGAPVSITDAAPEAAEKRPAAAARSETPEVDAAMVERIGAALRYRYPHAREAGLPSKLTATELRGDYPSAEAAERAEAAFARAPAPLRRPRFAQAEQGLTGAERGTALHLAMQYIDFARTGSIAEIEAELRRMADARLLLPEQAACVDARRILRFFRSETGRRLLGADALWREFKFSLLTPAGQLLADAGSDEPVLLQGVVDCCFRQGDALTVLDFKTDWVTPETLGAHAETYRGQLEAYAGAMTRILGLPVREKLLYFFTLGETVPLV